MGMQWIRLDTQFASNPKILYLIEDQKWRSIVVWAASLAYAGTHGTDGFIPKSALNILHGTPRDAKNLVEVSLWVESLGGWEINSWAEFQPSSQEMENRRKRAQAAAMRRWHGEK
jgi:hypothetical protein